MNTMSNNQAFAKEVPSLFIVETPFQAMCAINTIRQLNIEKYELLLHLHKTTEKRNKQTIEIVERYGLNYSVREQKRITMLDRIGLLFSRTGRYKRVFLGTHLYQNGYYYVLKEISKGGDVVLLDDGIATLSLLENDYKVTGRSIIYMAFYRAIASYRKVSMNNVFTVYKGIENPNWNVAFNDISLLRKVEMSHGNKGVFFIGTNNGGFIREGVDELSFKQSLFYILKRVKKIYPLDEILYIPHGRDKSSFAKAFCEEIGIIYTPLDVNVEIYLLSLPSIPKAIYGFTSSALYNLKKIFPEVEVKNLVMKLLVENSPSILKTSNYYERQGIPAINV